MNCRDDGRTSDDSSVRIVKEDSASYRLHDHFLPHELPLGVQNLVQKKKERGD